MSLFGSNRDSRRRRSLAEESAASSAPAAPSSPARPPAKGERYTPAARPEQHRRVSDFVPRSGWTLAVAYLGGLTVVAGLLAGQAASADLVAQPAVARLLDASQGGSLAGWFSAFVFGWAAAASVLVYSIRRHKLDDYGGRYRLWLWSAVAWLVMSVDAVANLHTPFSQAMSTLTKWSMAPDGAAWWIGAWGVVLAILILRLSIEVRGCRVATAAVVGSFALWTVALVVDYAWLKVGPHAAVVATGCRLVGQLTLLLSIGAYARHVLLDSQGLIAARPERKRVEKKVKTVTVGGGSDSAKTRIDGPHDTADLKRHVQPASRPVATSTSFAANRSASAPVQANDRDSSYNEYDEEADDSGNDQRLSKAERKRLRKMMRRQQRDEDE